MKREQPKPEELLQKRKWKKFLLAIPLNKPKGYSFLDANDMNTIRVRATQLNKDTSCERKFSVSLNLDTKIATITASNK